MPWPGSPRRWKGSHAGGMLSLKVGFREDQMHPKGWLDGCEIACFRKLWCSVHLWLHSLYLMVSTLCLNGWFPVQLTGSEDTPYQGGLTQLQFNLLIHQEQEKATRNSSLRFCISFSKLCKIKFYSKINPMGLKKVSKAIFHNNHIWRASELLKAPKKH